MFLFLNDFISLIKLLAVKIKFHVLPESIDLNKLFEELIYPVCGDSKYILCMLGIFKLLLVNVFEPLVVR